KGIYDELKWATRYHVPLYITETGVDDGMDTGSASKWIAETFQRVKRAINENVDARGYFYWTLMDNYESNHGMSIKMGVYDVHPCESQEARTARSPVATYGKIAQAKEFPAELAAKYPIP